MGLTALALALSAQVARADLFQLSGVNPAVGYPFWYQDENGLALDQCLPNANDPGNLQATACLVFPGPPDPPFVFPGNFPEEQFYFRAVSDPMPIPGGKRALLVLALEGAFAGGPVAPGDQVVFTRIRVTAGVPVAGTYTVRHPYGEEVFPDVVPGVGNRDIIFSEDIGLTPGVFTDALHSRLGPFLTPAAAPGGAPLAPVTINGQRFLSDGATPVFITGSPFGTNFFELCGPPGSDLGGPGVNCQTINTFTVTGRLHNGNPGSPLRVTRSTYSRTAAGAHVDVTANAVPAPLQNAPLLSVGGAGLPSVLMAGPSALGNFYGQGTPTDPAAVPSEVIVVNSGDNPPSSIHSPVVDVVTVDQADYDPATGALTIHATSSDQVDPPALTALGSVLVGGSLVVNVGAVPPESVTVQSARGGSATAPVNMGAGGTFAPGAAIAIDDSASTNAGTPVTINLVANDIGANPATVTIASQPAHATVSVNLLGVASYNPTTAFVGTDTFTYFVRNAGGIASNVATVTVTLNVPPGGVAPIAVNDGPFTVPRLTTATFNVLANDSTNGGAPFQTVSIVGPVVGGTATVDASNRIVFTAGGVAGQFAISYRVTNGTGQISNLATVFGLVTNPDILSVTRAQLTQQDRRWVIAGTSSVPGPGNTITIHIGTTLAGTVLGSAEVDAVGVWKLDLRGSNILPDASRTISVESTRGGQLLAVPITLK